MRVAVLATIGVLGLGATAISAHATPLAPVVDHAKPEIIQVYGGCGPGYGRVPGHWRGPYWVPPHCAPRRHWGPGPYWRPHHWHHRHHWRHW